MSYRRALFWSAALLLNGAAALSAGDVVATITDNTGTTIRVSNLVTRYEFRAASDLKWVTTTMGGLVVTVWGHQGAARWEQRLGFELADLKRISFGHKPELRLEIVRRDGTALTITMTSLSGPGRISWTNLPLTDRLPCHGLDYESRWHTSYAG
jgi:hypothetical protein